MKLAIAQMILERAAFRHRDDYLSVPPNTPVPQSNVALNLEMGRAEQDPNARVLVRLTATSSEESVYRFDVSYVVIYAIEWDEGEQVPDGLDKRLVATGGMMLFPFVRETVANLSARGRFGPTWLAPVNFFNAVVEAPAPAPEPVAAAP